MDKRNWMSIAAGATVAIVLALWRSLEGYSVSGHVVVGLFVLCPYVHTTVHRSDNPRHGWQNVLMVLGATLAIGLFSSQFFAPVPGTFVSADCVIAAALGVLVLVYWGITRRRNRQPHWSLAVGLTYTISGAVFAFLDLALNYGPK